MLKVGAWDWKKSRYVTFPLLCHAWSCRTVEQNPRNKTRYKQDLEAFFWSGAARRPAEDAFASYFNGFPKIAE